MSLKSTEIKYLKLKTNLLPYYMCNSVMKAAPLAAAWVSRERRGEGTVKLAELLLGEILTINLIRQKMYSRWACGRVCAKCESQGLPSEQNHSRTGSNTR
jgi:hypothetical protein